MVSSPLRGGIVVSFREYSEDVSTKRIAHAIDEAWRVSLHSQGCARVLAGFIFKLREDPTWTEEDIRAVMAGIHQRIQEDASDSSSGTR